MPSTDDDRESDLDGAWRTSWETVAVTVPDAPALVHGDLVRTWAEFEAAAARLAAHLDAAGVGHDAKLACYLYNGPEYLESTFAAFKVRAAPINVNYRYLEAELEYLLDNADAQVVVFDIEFAERLDHIRQRRCRRSHCGSAWEQRSISPSLSGPWLRGGHRRQRGRCPRSSAPARTCGSSTPAAPPACPRG